MMMATRAVSGLMAVFFLWATYVQNNDPDPWRWMPMYFSAAVVAFAFAAGRPLSKLALTVAIVALIWAAAIVPELIGKWSPSELNDSMSAAHPEVEFGRELGGLLIVAAHSLLVFFRGRRVVSPS
jgi:hypothetical protein